MEYFDKKEEVIDLQLTNFGRYLLSQGKLNPKFYSFFDDNVAYDIKRAGLTELQNDSAERIKQSQTIVPQSSYSSLEKEFNTSYENMMSGLATAETAVEQKNAEKNYALPQPLGSMKLDAEYAPSWSVRFLNGYIASSAKNIELTEKNGGKQTLQIPQIETTIEIKVANVEASEEATDPVLEGPSLSGLVITSPEEDQFSLVKIFENNAEFQKKNFDIEVFEIVNEVQDGVEVEKLRPLYFTLPYQINNDMDPVEAVTPEDNPNYVAHYFDISVDEEIQPSTLCEYDPTNNKLGVFADDRAVICQDILNEKKKRVFNIYEPGTQDTPGEIC